MLFHYERCKKMNFLHIKEQDFSELPIKRLGLYNDRIRILLETENNLVSVVVRSREKVVEVIIETPETEEKNDYFYTKKIVRIIKNKYKIRNLLEEEKIDWFVTRYPIETFSPKETEVYNLLIRGLTYKEMLEELGIEDTRHIDNAIQRIRKKCEKSEGVILGDIGEDNE